MSPGEARLDRSGSSRKALQATSVRLSSSTDTSDAPLVGKFSIVPVLRQRKSGKVVTIIRSILSLFPLPPLIPASCRWLGLQAGRPEWPALGRRVTGTLFGHRKGHVNFAVQEDPRSEPVLLLELAMPTGTLVKEMASGLVRIALECERGNGRSGVGSGGVKLFQEPMWTMYCNGRKTGYAVSRACTQSDWHVLSTVQTVSIGAGVLPVDQTGCSGGGSEGELMYMRARFERVVGSRDSEAFYMMNPDGSGGPELSIFLLRI